MNKWSEEELEAKLKDNPDLKVKDDDMARTVPPIIEPKMPTNANNTHHARKTWSELIGRWFDSKAEARRGEELFLLQKAGEIRNLEFQKTYVLSNAPKVTITIDFGYEVRKDNPGGTTWFWSPVHEDVKGERLTKKRKIKKPRVERDFQVKLAWLQQRYGIQVRLHHE